MVLRLLAAGEKKNKFEGKGMKSRKKKNCLKKNFDERSDAAAGAESERQIERANVTGSPNRINTASRSCFLSLSEMIFRFIFFVPLLCEAALREDPVCK